ncbi:NUDIX hydrolase [Methylocapsa palsarum]|uniref:ADP-ribose pyrophosphatase YjhB, NUDIX family n=1 Tax=Methylocapsa palsarum TaxID=1612308 RepID=A0A1I3Y0Z8_9HYPH|nr:NUDIX hydrolase [Methylocapsa palsarum]SFK24916.1 ADP-ribose pyrophosphatase YjhB, NUDIX family [Methylocapsa palsarum]
MKGGADIPTSRKSGREKHAIRVQYGALPYRFSKSGALEILLVTTRQTKRWIIPKGWPIKGLKPAKSAAREAYEEAGVRGAVKAKAIGIFSYEKRLDEGGITIPCDVKVFPLLVKRQAKTWPESGQRVAQWLEPLAALSLVKEESLRNLLASFIDRLAASGALPRRKP